MTNDEAVKFFTSYVESKRSQLDSATTNARQELDFLTYIQGIVDTGYQSDQQAITDAVTEQVNAALAALTPPVDPVAIPVDPVTDPMIDPATPPVDPITVDPIKP